MRLQIPTLTIASRSRRRTSRLPRRTGISHREWRFEPEKREKPEYDREESVGSLNPLLNVMHYFMLGVLVMVTANYLLGCLYKRS